MNYISEIVNQNLDGTKRIRLEHLALKLNPELGYDCILPVRKINLPTHIILI